jgi:hypothetical protein
VGDQPVGAIPSGRPSSRTRFTDVAARPGPRNPVPTMTRLGSCCSTTRLGLAAVTAGPSSCSKAMDNAAAARARSTMTNSPRTTTYAFQSAVGPPDQGGRRTVERTTTLIRAMDKHRRDGRPVRSHPNKGWVLWTAEGSSNATTASVCAGHRLGGAPCRNRTGDPILTMDRRPSAVLPIVFAAHATP